MGKRFSERIGAVEARKTLQLEEMSGELRASLWNVFFVHFDAGNRGTWPTLARRVAVESLRVPADTIPAGSSREFLRSIFVGDTPWYTVYDTVEFLAKENDRLWGLVNYGVIPRGAHSSNSVEGKLNEVLERELAGYRFVAGELSPVTSEAEIKSIEDAVREAQVVGLEGPAIHIQTAVRKLGQRPEPDYRNAIKEAISAVESVAIKICGKKNAKLSDALKILKSKGAIHGAMEKGFSNLYGYTSNQEGIRHAILEEANVGYAEAKYMIVACSAFVHYLLQKADELGLLEEAGSS